MWNHVKLEECFTLYWFQFLELDWDIDIDIDTDINIDWAGSNLD